MTSTIFRIGAFSTNNEEYPPISIIQKFFVASICRNISYIKENHVEFEHTLSNSFNEIHTNFIQILNYDKGYNICNCADCFIVFIDLECKKSESNYENIVHFISDKCNIDKTIFLLSFITQEDNEKEYNLKKENVFTDIISKTNLHYEFLEIHLYDQENLVKNIETVFTQCLEIKLNLHRSRLEDEHNDNNGSSGCLIY